MFCPKIGYHFDFIQLKNNRLICRRLGLAITALSAIFRLLILLS